MKTLRNVAQCALAAAIVVAAGCGGPVTTVPRATASSAGPLSLSQTNLSFSGTAQSLNVTVTDPGFSGVFAASGCGGTATTAVSGATVTVTAAAAGSCTLTVSDGLGNSAPLAVTVTTLGVPVQ